MINGMTFKLHGHRIDGLLEQANAIVRRFLAERPYSLEWHAEPVELPFTYVGVPQPGEHGWTVTFDATYIEDEDE